jgi:hypothetical protein
MLAIVSTAHALPFPTQCNEPLTPAVCSVVGFHRPPGQQLLLLPDMLRIMARSNGRFQNKAVLITGAPPVPVSRAAPLAFAREGARVVIAARGG